MSKQSNVRDIYSMLGGGGFNFSEDGGITLPVSRSQVSGVFVDYLLGYPFAKALCLHGSGESVVMPIESLPNKDIKCLRDVVAKYHSLSLDREQNLNEICSVVLGSDTAVHLQSPVSFEMLQDSGEGVAKRSFTAKSVFASEPDGRIFVCAEPSNPTAKGEVCNFEIGWLNDRTVHSIAKALTMKKNLAKVGVDRDVEPAPKKSNPIHLR